MHIFTLDRIFHYPDRSVGKLLLPSGGQFCYTLEDCPRAYGIKVKGATAIPTNNPSNPYRVDVTYSNRFKKDLPVIYTGIEAGDYVLRNGIEFTAVRFHGGNKPDHTEGCILVGFQSDQFKIWDSAEDKLTELIKELLKTDKVGLAVRNSKNRI